MLPLQENGKSRLQQAQEDVDEVKVIMLDNLNKADERSGKLEELEDRAEDLLEKVRSVLSVLTASARPAHTRRVHCCVRRVLFTEVAARRRLTGPILSTVTLPT